MMSCALLCGVRDWVGLVHHELGKETLLAMVGNKALRATKQSEFSAARKFLLNSKHSQDGLQ